MKFISIAEKDITEKYMNIETAMVHQVGKIMEEGPDREEKAERRTSDRDNNEDIPSGIDIQKERKLMEESGGFYNLKKSRKEAEHLEHGTFFMENGKIYYGTAEKREPVSYSNWYAGNVDPEQLNRHKQLLDRQHFSGPFWENRQMPKSVLDETFEEYLTGIEHEAPEAHPSERGYKEDKQRFETIKR